MRIWPPFPWTQFRPSFRKQLKQQVSFVSLDTCQTVVLKTTDPTGFICLLKTARRLPVVPSYLFASFDCMSKLRHRGCFFKPAARSISRNPEIFHTETSMPSFGASSEGKCTVGEATEPHRPPVGGARIGMSHSRPDKAAVHNIRQQAPKMSGPF